MRSVFTLLALLVALALVALLVRQQFAALRGPSSPTPAAQSMPAAQPGGAAQTPRQMEQQVQQQVQELTQPRPMPEDAR